MRADSVHICLYLSEADVSALELVAETLGVMTKRRSSHRKGRTQEAVGNKSAAVRVLTAAALKHIAAEQRDAATASRASELLDSVAPTLPATNVQVKSQLVKKLTWTSTDGTPLPTRTFKTCPTDTSYEIEVK